MKNRVSLGKKITARPRSAGRHGFEADGGHVRWQCQKNGAALAGERTITVRGGCRYRKARYIAARLATTLVLTKTHLARGTIWDRQCRGGTVLSLRSCSASAEPSGGHHRLSSSRARRVRSAAQY